MTVHSRLNQLARGGAAMVLPMVICSTVLPEAGIGATVKVQVEQQGNTRTASMIVPVPPERVWAVLTDYVATGEAMPDISNVQLLSKQGNSLRLRQTYQAPYTFGLKISAVIAVTETPKKAIRFRMLEGDHIKTLSGSWKLSPTKTGTRLQQTITLVPELPGLVQTLFAQLTRDSLSMSMQRLSLLMQKT